MRRVLLLGLAAALALAGCARDTGYCEEDGDCPGGLRCSADTHLCYPLLGYGELIRGAYADALACPMLSSPELYQGVDLERRACAGCACMAPTCSGQARSFTMTLCGGADAPGLNLSQGCNRLSGQPSFRIDTTAVSCAVDASKARPVPSVVDHARLCAPGTAPCSSLDCVLRAGAQAAGPWCLLLDGEALCPPAFPVGQRWHRGYDDSRSCTCRCTPSNNQCVLTGYLDTGCMGTTRLVKTGTCYTDNPLVFSLAAAPTAACTASSEVSAAGTFRLSAPVTVCCNR